MFRLALVACTTFTRATFNRATLSGATLAGATLTCATLALTFTGCEKKAPPAPPPIVAENVETRPDTGLQAADTACTADAECTLTTNDCCGCAALGTQVGVRADHLAALTARRQPICSSIVCAQQMSDDPSCTARKAVCRAGQCVPDIVK
jgi:hypothetical protein